MSHKVWVQVEVEEGRPGETNPRLIGGVDIEQARQAFLDLLAFRPHEGTVRFGTGNPMYEKDDEFAPLFTERYLYPAFGWKEPGRSLLARLERLQTALGVSREQVHEAWGREGRP